MTTTRSSRPGTRPSPMAPEHTGRPAAQFRARHPEPGVGIVSTASEGDHHPGPLDPTGERGAFTRRADAVAGTKDLVARTSHILSTPIRTTAAVPSTEAARTGWRAGRQLLHAGTAGLLGGPA
ncbi:hypothetical protein [Streptomyces sp. NPDC057682]|uniref:hypothetical protein n=1 Tax=Streptomyces sp. NPDC057682 TaxID=3346210 RepID=UPI00368CC9EA